MSSIYSMAQSTNLPGSNVLANLAGTDGQIKATDSVGIAKETAVSYPVSYPTALMAQIQQSSNFTVGSSGGGGGLGFPSGGGGLPPITIPVGSGGGSSKPPDSKPPSDEEIDNTKDSILQFLAGIFGLGSTVGALQGGGLSGIIPNMLLGILAIGLILLGGYVLFK